MKKLFLHVGFGKTGSSALQSWLANKSEKLSELGYEYKVLDENSINYRVSSGNGSYLRSYLNGDITLDKVVGFYFSSSCENIIISSETFEMDQSKLDKLKKLSDDLDIELNVLAYVRNAYDCFYSTYVQGVKRSGLTANISSMVDRINPIRHIDSAWLYYRNLSNIKFVHYDKCKGDVARPFCDFIGVDYDSIGHIESIRVNRTLNRKEIIAIKYLVEKLGESSISGSGAISRLLSDHLVNTHKNVDSEVFIYKNILDYFTEKYKSDVDRFNECIGFENNIKLEFVDLNDNRIMFVDDSDSDSYNCINFDIIKEMCDLILSKTYLFDSKQIARLALAINDVLPGVSHKLVSSMSSQVLNADILRDSAVLLEDKNIEFSKYLMELAGIARPSGAFIQKKIMEYKLKCQK